jgi:hypothetical protein
MITLSNGTAYEQAVLKAILQLKNVPLALEPVSTQPLRLDTPEFHVEGFLCCTLFADEKWPIPELFHGSVDARAHMRQITRKTALAANAENTREIRDLLEHTHHASPYLIGERVCILDVLLLPFINHAPNPTYAARLTEDFTRWLTSQSGEDWSSYSF